MPVFEKIGDVRSLLVARANAALIYLERQKLQKPGDRGRATELLALALADAERLQIPEAEQIREIQRRHGLV